MKMNIQLITTDTWEYREWNLTVSPFSAPLALGMFDVNVIDLSGEFLWQCHKDNWYSSDHEDDFTSLKTCIAHAQHIPILFVLPQNISFRYNYSETKSKYRSSILLKNMLTEFHLMLAKVMPGKLVGDLIFENSITKIGNEQYTSAFAFLGTPTSGATVLTQAEGSRKATTISSGRFYATTLHITEDQQGLLHYLHAINLLKTTAPACPEWVLAYDFCDDNELRSLIHTKTGQIHEAKQAIANAEERLKDNLAYKSILCESGEFLVKNVFRILQEILECDLSSFIDRKREDFLIESGTSVFIGEIKGVSSNVKFEPISQVERHYHAYIDEHEQVDPSSVKQLLIINPFRTKPLNERDPVHENQINLAKRNGCLIITTAILLKIFERFRKHEMSTADIKKVFSSEVGLLSMDAFETMKES